MGWVGVEAGAPQELGKLTCVGGSQAAEVVCRVHGLWKPQGLDCLL